MTAMRVIGLAMAATVVALAVAVLTPALSRDHVCPDCDEIHDLWEY